MKYVDTVVDDWYKKAYPHLIGAGPAVFKRFYPNLPDFSINVIIKFLNGEKDRKGRVYTIGVACAQAQLSPFDFQMMCMIVNSRLQQETAKAEPVSETISDWQILDGEE